MRRGRNGTGHPDRRAGPCHQFLLTMSTPMIAEQIAKLPKWAQEHIRNLERERKTAIDALNDQLDNVTPSPFYTEDFLSLGENQCGPTIKRRNFQAHGKIFVEHAGVKLSIYLRRDDAIELGWDSQNRGLEEIAFIPASFQQARLVARANMRT